MTENEEFIFESIFQHIRMGFTSISDIREIILEQIEDNGFSEEISEAWAVTRIDEEYQKVLEESKTWNSLTDTERLIDAFDELCRQNIIALHNAGYTTSEGESYVVDVEQSLRENNIISDGYCFYHEQDLSRAITPENSNLSIAYQKIDNSDPAVTLEVGKKVVKVLTEKGFQVDWDEDVNTKILIPDFKWQHIYQEEERDLHDFEEVIDLILENNSPAGVNEKYSFSRDERRSWWKFWS